MAAVVLRNAIKEDAATLGSLHVASWRETYTGIVADELLAGLSVGARADMWRKILTTPDTFGCRSVFIAEDDGRAVGFGCCGRQRDADLSASGFGGEFQAIYVLRSHQRRGVGRSLMAAMAQELCRAGHRSASLWVLKENCPARAFYGGIGGVVVAEKLDEGPPAPLVEYAYGWRDTSRLISL